MAAGDGLPAGRHLCGELLLVVGLDPSAMAGVAERGWVALAHELRAQLFDAADHVLVADLLTQQPAVEAKLVGVFIVAKLQIAGVDRQATKVHRLVHGVFLALTPAGLGRLEAVKTDRVPLGRRCAILGAIATHLPVEDARDAPRSQVQNEPAIGLAREGHAEDHAVQLELEAGRFDGLLKQLEQIVVGTGQLVCLEDPLAGVQGKVAVVRLHLALENRAKLELGGHGLAEEGMGQHRLRVGVEGAAHGGRLLLRQSRRGVVGQVADVELVLVFVPERHRRIAE